MSEEAKPNVAEHQSHTVSTNGLAAIRVLPARQNRHFHSATDPLNPKSYTYTTLNLSSSIAKYNGSEPSSH